MSHDATPPEHDPDIKHMADDINAPMLIVALAVTVVVVIVAIFGVQALYYYGQDLERQEKIVNAEYRDSESKLNEAEQTLTTVRWVDRNKQIVTMRIDDAMEAVVEELSAAQAGPEEDTFEETPEQDTDEQDSAEPESDPESDDKG